jgi:hypothetical protein
VGTWDTGIFGGDLAADVRDDWRQAILDRLTPEQAASRVLEQHADALADADDGVVVWLALAAAQAQTGRLQAKVRDQALAILDAGGDLARWEESGPDAVARRKRALDRLGASLRRPQRPATKLRRPRVRRSPLAIGDVVRVRSEDGPAEALCIVVDLDEGWPPGSTEPVVVTLSWQGGPLPTPEEMETLPLLLDSEESRPRRPVALVEKVLTATRGTLALAGYGEVVATGVRRRDDTIDRSQRRISTTWRGIAHWIGSDRFRRELELARSG